MAIVRNLTLPWQSYAIAVAGPLFIPAGGWMLTGSVTGVRSWGEMRGANGLFRAQPGIQVANDVRTPGSITLIGSLLAADGVFDPATAVAVTNGASSRFMRPGWSVSLSSGTNLATAGLYCIIELQY